MNRPKIRIMKKLVLVLLIALSSCSKNQEEEVCNCRENTYERRYINSNSYVDDLIGQEDIDGCYTLDEAKEKVWTTSENYTIIQCDDYI